MPAFIHIPTDLDSVEPKPLLSIICSKSQHNPQHITTLRNWVARCKHPFLTGAGKNRPSHHQCFYYPWLIIIREGVGSEVKHFQLFPFVFSGFSMFLYVCQCLFIVCLRFSFFLGEYQLSSWKARSDLDLVHCNQQRCGLCPIRWSGSWALESLQLYRIRNNHEQVLMYNSIILYNIVKYFSYLLMFHIHSYTVYYCII